MRESGGASMVAGLREQPGAHGTSEGASRGVLWGWGGSRGGLGRPQSGGQGGRPRVATDGLGKGDCGRLGETESDDELRRQGRRRVPVLARGVSRRPGEHGHIHPAPGPLARGSARPVSAAARWNAADQGMASNSDRGPSPLLRLSFFSMSASTSRSTSLVLASGLTWVAVFVRGSACADWSCQGRLCSWL